MSDGSTRLDWSKSPTSGKWKARNEDQVLGKTATELRGGVVVINTGKSSSSSSTSKRKMDLTKDEELERKIQYIESLNLDDNDPKVIELRRLQKEILDMKQELKDMDSRKKRNKTTKDESTKLSVDKPMNKKIQRKKKKDSKCCLGFIRLGCTYDRKLGWQTTGQIGTRHEDLHLLYIYISY